MFRKFLKEYFTFTRSERNGIIVLICIILVVVAARIIIPHIRKNKSYDFSRFRDEINAFEKSLSETGEGKADTHLSEQNTRLFLFDPNTATEQELRDLGLTTAVVRNILKYRENKGTFRVPEDLRKIYGLDSSSYLRIRPFIRITMTGESAGPDSGIYRKTQDQPGYKPIVIPLPLNSSDSVELAGIHGIGPALSVRIIKYRSLLGGYVRKEQLLEVYGMTRDHYDKIRDFVFIDTLAITKIDLNTTHAARLSRHPYLNDYQAKALISYREMKGKYQNTNEIIRNDLLPDSVYQKVKPYLTVH